MMEFADFIIFIVFYFALVLILALTLSEVH